MRKSSPQKKLVSRKESRLSFVTVILKSVSSEVVFLPRQRALLCAEGGRQVVGCAGQGKDSQGWMCTHELEVALGEDTWQVTPSTRPWEWLQEAGPHWLRGFLGGS